MCTAGTTPSLSAGEQAGSREHQESGVLHPGRQALPAASVGAALVPPVCDQASALVRG